MNDEEKLEYIDIMIGKTARAMKKQMKLPKNLQKDLWFNMTNEQIMIRIKEELKELEEILNTSIYQGSSLPEKRKMDIEWKRKKIIEESADVCNFLGFLIDNQGGEI